MILVSSHTKPSLCPTSAHTTPSHSPSRKSNQKVLMDAHLDGIVLDDLAEDMQERAPTTHNLPIELLFQIFTIHVHDHNQSAWNLTSVCSIWRNLALSMPKLWNSLILSSRHSCTNRSQERHEVCNSVTRLQIALQRAGESYPLDVNIRLEEYFTPISSEEMLGMLRLSFQQLSRIRELRIYANRNILPTGDITSPLIPDNIISLPLLRHFSVDFIEQSGAHDATVTNFQGLLRVVREKASNIVSVGSRGYLGMEAIASLSNSVANYERLVISDLNFDVPFTQFLLSTNSLKDIKITNVDMRRIKPEVLAHVYAKVQKLHLSDNQCTCTLNGQTLAHLEELRMYHQAYSSYFSTSDPDPNNTLMTCSLPSLRLLEIHANWYNIILGFDVSTLETLIVGDEKDQKSSGNATKSKRFNEIAAKVSSWKTLTRITFKFMTLEPSTVIQVLHHLPNLQEVVFHGCNADEIFAGDSWVRNRSNGYTCSTLQVLDCILREKTTGIVRKARTLFSKTVWERAKDGYPLQRARFGVDGRPLVDLTMVKRPKKYLEQSKVL